MYAFKAHIEMEDILKNKELQILYVPERLADV